MTNDLIDKVSMFLYEADPAGTMCQENEAEDEYYNEAAYVSGLLTEQSTTEQIWSALEETFGEFFEDCEIDHSSLNQVAVKIKAEISRSKVH